MANEKNELSSVNWGEIFGFTRVFKSFRLAINLSALTLGLAAVILIWLTGSVMDRLAFTSQGVMKDEVRIFNIADRADFVKIIETWEKDRPGAVATLRGAVSSEKFSRSKFIAKLQKKNIDNKEYVKAFQAVVDTQNKGKTFTGTEKAKLEKDAKDDWSGELKKTRKEAREYFEGIEDVILTAYNDAEKEVEKLAKEDRAKAEDDLKDYFKTAKRTLTGAKTETLDKIENIRGGDIFESFVTYETDNLNGAAMALLSGNITKGLTEYLAEDKTKVRQVPASQEGFLVKMLSAARGVQWLFSMHWLYGTILLIASLAIWALFGGAIHRIVAVQAAREEKISLFQALRFSRDKFKSFFFAPLMPLAIILGVGVLMLAGGLLVNLPWWLGGPILAGLLFFLALILGLVVAFMLVGLIGGAGLMFPTIAVEGSDAFDAMGRSFSYTFSRPWRAGLYAVAAIVHGAICYMFVRVFAFLALRVTHFFVSGSVWANGDALPGVANPDRMDVLWTTPTLTKLHDCNFEAMSGAETVAAVLILIWVYLIIALVSSFVLTYMASATTSIYYLLRRKVDATDYDEVYIEEEDEQIDFGAPAEAPAPAEADVETPAEAPAETKAKTKTKAKAKAKTPGEDVDEDAGKDEKTEE